MSLRSGKFTYQLMEMGRWIIERKRFAFIAPDYIVIGMSLDEYNKLVKEKPQISGSETMYFEDEVGL